MEPKVEIYKKFQILFLIRGSMLNRGMNTGLENLAFALAERGHSITIFSGGNKPEKELYKISNRINYIFLGTSSELFSMFKDEVFKFINSTLTDY